MPTHTARPETTAQVDPLRNGPYVALADTMNTPDLKERTMRFAVDAASLCRAIQQQWPGRRVADQLFRSSTSVAANYHAACRARSRREFIAKLGIVIEETEETVFWLEFGSRTGLAASPVTGRLVQEGRELLAIFTASSKTAAAGLPSHAKR